MAVGKKDTLLLYVRFAKPEVSSKGNQNNSLETTAEWIREILSDAYRINEKNRRDRNDEGGRLPHSHDYFTNKSLNPSLRIPKALNFFNKIRNLPTGLLALNVKQYLHEELKDLPAEELSFERKTLNQRTAFVDPQMYKVEYMQELYVPEDWQFPESLGHCELARPDKPFAPFQRICLDRDLLQKVITQGYLPNDISGVWREQYDPFDRRQGIINPRVTSN